MLYYMRIIGNHKRKRGQIFILDNYLVVKNKDLTPFRFNTFINNININENLSRNFIANTLG